MEVDNSEYAGFWIRVLATIVDMILSMMIILPLLFAVYGSLVWESEAIILGYADVLISLVFPFIAVVLFWHYKSATLGKMLFKIKVIDASSGGKLSITQSIIRYFAYIPAGLVFCIGFIWIAFDKRKQGWHDKIAGTLVIKTNKENL